MASLSSLTVHISTDVLAYAIARRALEAIVEETEGVAVDVEYVAELSREALAAMDRHEREAES